jgi:SAM-dependent methyltransferase
MCTTCQLPALNESAAEAFGERMLQTINSGMIALMVSVGHRTGLFDSMAGQPFRDSREIAAAAGLNERYVREWLGAMVTGAIVDYDDATRRYRLPGEHAACLTRSAGADNMAGFTQYLSVLGSVEDRIVECFENGGGVSYDEFPRFQAVMAEDSGQSVLPTLVDQILPLAPGLVARLEEGIDVLDVGFGLGRALNLLARRFPNSRFTGYEISDEGLLAARSEAEAHGTTNLRVVKQDAAGFSDVEAFDLICSFDSVHDQADPAAMLRNIHRALRPGGVYLMQDIDTRSDVGLNRDHPLGPMIYTISCMHCMTVSLAAGGEGLGAAWGVDTAERMLGEAGFRQIEVSRLPHDVQNAYFVNRK